MITFFFFAQINKKKLNFRVVWEKTQAVNILKKNAQKIYEECTITACYHLLPIIQYFQQVLQNLNFLKRVSIDFNWLPSLFQISRFTQDKFISF